eukprot:gene1539-biopygen5497
MECKGPPRLKKHLAATLSLVGRWAARSFSTPWAASGEGPVPGKLLADLSGMLNALTYETRFLRNCGVMARRLRRSVRASMIPASPRNSPRINSPRIKDRIRAVDGRNTDGRKGLM